MRMRCRRNKKGEGGGGWRGRKEKGIRIYCLLLVGVVGGLSRVAVEEVSLEEIGGERDIYHLDHIRTIVVHPDNHIREKRRRSKNEEEKGKQKGKEKEVDLYTLRSTKVPMFM